MTTKTRAPRVAEIAADEGYNLQGAPVLLAKLTAYVSRPLFAQLAAIATACNGEYSKHNAAFQFPIDATAARESFAAQARVILTNPPPAADAPATAAQARAQSHRAARAAQSTAEARAYAASKRDPAHDAPEEIPLEISYGRTVIHRTAPATSYTDAPTQETPPAIRVSVSRPIGSTITDRTPAGYGPAQPALF